MFFFISNELFFGRRGCISEYSSPYLCVGVQQSSPSQNLGFRLGYSCPKFLRKKRKMLRSLNHVVGQVVPESCTDLEYPENILNACFFFKNELIYTDNLSTTKPRFQHQFCYIWILNVIILNFLSLNIPMSSIQRVQAWQIWRFRFSKLYYF